MSPKLSAELKVQRRLQILEAAKRVFVRKGYEAATLKDIVEEAEMSRGWIYLYFQTKEEIFEALMRKTSEDIARELTGRLSAAASIWKVLEAHLLRHKKELETEQISIASVFYEYFITCSRDETRRRLLALRYEASAQQMLQMLTAGVDSGEFMPQLPLELIVKILSSHLDGIMMHAFAVGSHQVNAAGQIEALLSNMKQLLGVREGVRP